MPLRRPAFPLHKFEQRIGRGTYRLTRTAQAHTYNVECTFVDRGSPVVCK